MTTTTHPSRRRPSPYLIGSLLGATVASVVAVAAVGRFVHPDARPAATAVTAAPQSLTESVHVAEQRVTATPDDPAQWTTLGSLYIRQAAATGDPTYYTLAGTALGHAGTLAPTAPTTLIARAGLALAVHDFATAHDLAGQAVVAAPHTPGAYPAAVDAAVELGRYDEAAERLQTLLDLKPDSAALSRTSYLRELHGDMAGAVSSMEAAEQAAVSEPASHAVIAAYLGDVLLGQGDVTGAHEAYDRALAAAPGLVNASLGEARVQVAQGHLIDAEAALAALVQRSPQPAVATLLADVRSELGNAAGAADAEALVRANDTLLTAAGVTIDLESAIFEADHGATTTALSYATAAYQARHTVFTADAMGWALTKSGRAAEAMPYVREALALGTTTASLHVHAAIAAEATGDHATATHELTVAFAQSPWFSLPLRDPASRLADALGVTVPNGWRP